MSKKKSIVNIYNFIRMSNLEPSEFNPDDFDTLRKQLIYIKHHGFPATYSLKYDALMDSRYQNLLKEYLDENDEISAMWEITQPLCQRAGIDFHDTREEEKYDDRLGSAYSLGYTPEERKRLVDAYMADFHEIFGKYPETIGSWVIDSVTLAYAQEKYGIVGAAICRDQLGVDGFTLWGGFPTGMYYPSRNNEYLPAQTLENQLSVPVFRLLGPDPIYNYEAGVRPEHGGVWTLEPAAMSGRDPKWISWIFTRMTDEDTLGPGYAMVGQENNFLWENIEPGFEPQLHKLDELAKTRDLRIETMATTARWYRKQYTRTAPMTWQASRDWDETMKLSTMWYASAGYRLSFLGEKHHLRIRDFFLYDENYNSRYLNSQIQTKGSLFDALPVLSPQLWKTRPEGRPFIRLLDRDGREPEGTAEYRAVSETQAVATLTDDKGLVQAKFTLTPGHVRLESEYRLHFDYLPQFTLNMDRVELVHNGFPYSFRIADGVLRMIGIHAIEILPLDGKLCLEVSAAAEGPFRIPEDVPDPVPVKSAGRPMPPLEPKAEPGSAAFSCGTVQKVTITAQPGGEIRYTLDGSEPTKDSLLYRKALALTRDTELKARCFMPDGTVSDLARYVYRFGRKNLKISSPTSLEPRPAFRGNGYGDLLQVLRGNTNYACGRWRGTTEDLDVTAELEKPEKVSRVVLGFLFHQRAGILLPESIDFYAGPDKDHMTLRESRPMPNRLLEHETVREDVIFQLHEAVGAVRLVAHRYEKIPEWGQYRGDTHIFTLTDCLVVEPERE